MSIENAKSSKGVGALGVQLVALVDGGGEVTVKGSNVAHAHAVSPDDDTDLTGVAAHGPAQFLYVGTAGDVGILTGGEVLLFAGLAAGVWHPLPPFTRVRDTGLSADDLIAGY